MRDYNERLVLSLVRQHGSLAKTEIARLTKLSAQTVSVIMRELEEEGLLLRNEPVRGKIGQPSIPMSLDPEGAFFLGLKIGRRSAELVLIDFLGSVRAMLQLSYRYPAPRETVEFVSARHQADPRRLDRVRRTGASPASASPCRSSCGTGPTPPARRATSWTIGATATSAPTSRRKSIFRSICRTTPPRPAAPSWCSARAARRATSSISTSAPSPAAASCSMAGSMAARPAMPARSARCRFRDRTARRAQLIDIASIAMLERALNAKGGDASFLWTSPEDWGELGQELDDWIVSAANGLAYAIVSASSVIDFQAAVVDGWMPAVRARRLVAAVGDALTTIDAEGLSLPPVREGTVGIHARALGGASLPLSDRFLVGATAAVSEG